MSTITLTTSQQATLAHAVAHTNGKIDWFPDHIKGGARQKVIDGLLNRALITRTDSDWLVTDQGYEALGVARPEPAVPLQSAPQATDPELDAAVTAAEAGWAKQANPRTRQNSKQALMIQMLQRPQGASIEQVMQATEWQSHTVRGFLAGTISKKLGLPLESSKQGKEARVYRIKNVEAQQSL